MVLFAFYRTWRVISLLDNRGINRSITAYPTSAASRAVTHFRHSGRQNLLFIDGHVEAVDISRFISATKVHNGNAEYWWIQVGKGKPYKIQIR